MSEYVPQGSSENVIYNFDFADAVSSDVDVISNGVAAVTPAGPTLGAVSIVGKIASVSVSGILFAQVYKVKVSVDVDTGEVLSKTLTIFGVER